MTVHDFLLPDLGEGLEDAEIVAWHVAEGDTVELNQMLVEVNTAKAMVEIPSPWAGVVEQLHGSEGDVIRVGAALVSIRVDGDAPVAEPPVEVVAVVETAETAETAENADAPKPVGTTETAEAAEAPKRRAVLVGYGVDENSAASGPRRRRFRGLERPGDKGHPRGPAHAEPHLPSAAAPTVRATPPVRRLAKDLGVDLDTLTGTGPNGRITRDDVTAATPPGSVASAKPVGRSSERPQDRRLPVRGVRRLVAERMSRSVREIPHVTTFLTLDATQLQAYRTHVAGETGERIRPLPVIVKALAEIVRDHPKLNASFDADASEIRLYGAVHVGIAADTEQGLMVPVVRDADRLGLMAIGREIARLTDAVRAGRARPEELANSTVTVSNVGTFGAEYGTPIINHPEAAVLAIGLIEPRAMVVDGHVQARDACTLSLSFDHRLMDGAEAGRALRALADLLENPFALGRLPL